MITTGEEKNGLKEIFQSINHRVSLKLSKIFFFFIQKLSFSKMNIINVCLRIKQAKAIYEKLDIFYQEDYLDIRCVNLVRNTFFLSGDGIVSLYLFDISFPVLFSTERKDERTVIGECFLI